MCFDRLTADHLLSERNFVWLSSQFRTSLYKHTYPSNIGAIMSDVATRLEHSGFALSVAPCCQ